MAPDKIGTFLIIFGLLFVSLGVSFWDFWFCLGWGSSWCKCPSQVQSQCLYQFQVMVKGFVKSRGKVVCNVRGMVKSKYQRCTNIPVISPKDSRKISHPELEISLYLCNFSKELSQLTDWQIYKKFRMIWKLCTNIPGMSQKNSERHIIQHLINLYICLISIRK